jgi:hypothetical protein
MEQTPGRAVRVTSGSASAVAVATMRRSHESRRRPRAMRKAEVGVRDVQVDRVQIDSGDLLVAGSTGAVL